MHPRLRRELLHTFWAWTFLASLGATAGAILGWLSIDNDTES